MSDSYEEQCKRRRTERCAAGNLKRIPSLGGFRKPVEGFGGNKSKDSPE